MAYIVGTNSDDIIPSLPKWPNNSGYDVIYALSGNDTVDGELGNDRIYGGGGSDTLIDLSGPTRCTARMETTS
jgi:Ca2+-binding RTX toxin-like protein